jgi:putative DNA primase/helicase
MTRLDEDVYIITRPGEPQGASTRSRTHGAAPRIALESVEDIPAELKTRPQWVVWRSVEKPNGKKLDKTPFQPNHTSRLARTNDPSGWSDFSTALRAYEANPILDGVGFVFDAEDPYLGFDFDDCVDPDTGALHEAVAELLEDLGGYAEVSPSGTGVKAIVRGRKPGARCSTKETPWGGEFAMYEKTRYFALTGRVLGEHREIGEAQEAVDRAYSAAFGEGENPLTATPTTTRCESEGRDIPLKDEDLIALACRSKYGERFSRHHHEGDTEGYASRSEADFAHLADLCFWTGADEERMVELFCRSALYVPEKGPSYVRRSARKAVLRHRGGFFRLSKKQQRPTEVLELVEELERRWWDEPFPGKLPSMLRALIREGKRSGTVLPGVGLRVSVSVRQLAEVVGCSKTTIMSATRTAEDVGILRKDVYNRKAEDSGAFVMVVAPRRGWYTPKNTGAERVLGGVPTPSRPAVADLTTDHHRWRSPVGGVRERLVCALEAFGTQTDAMLSERLGWRRARDLRHRHLEPLERMGLVERRGDMWALVRDFEAAQERVRKIPYSTIQLRLSRRWILDETGKRRRVTEVRETGSIATEEERELKDREDHAREREAYLRYLDKRRRAREREPEDDREIRELLNAWDEERGRESVQSTPDASEEVEYPGRIAWDVLREGTSRESGCEVFEWARELFV